jgi:hypothetical protein
MAVEFVPVDHITPMGVNLAASGATFRTWASSSGGLPRHRRFTFPRHGTGLAAECR